MRKKQREWERVKSRKKGMDNQQKQGTWDGIPESERTKRMTEREQEKLVQQASEGSKSALRGLCEAIARPVTFRVVRKFSRIGADQRDVEDVAQEILIRVCEGIDALKDPKAFGGWLNTIINNETNRYLTKHNKHGVVLSMDEYLENVVVEEDMDREILPEDYVIKEEERKAVMASLDTLSERQLEAVMLHYYEGMTITKTAESMNITTQAVSIHLARAKETIRGALTKKQRDTGTPQSGSFTALPLGAIVAKILYEEEALTPILSDTCIEKALEAGFTENAVVAEAESMVAAGGGALRLGLVLTGAAVLVVAAIFFSSIIWEKNFATTAEVVTHVGEFNETPEGDVLFSGGDTQQSTVNPSFAEARGTNERGNLVVHGWEITAIDSDEVLFSGEGAQASGVFTQMKEGGFDGNYTIWFTMEDAAGYNYTLYREFSILSAPEAPQQE